MMTRTDSSNVSGPQPPFMKGEVPMHLKSTDHRPDGQPPWHKCSPPPRFFRGRAGAAAMTRRIATLALAGAALGLFSPVQAQERDEVLQSVSEGDVDLPNDNSTSGRVAVGGSATGTIGTAGDQDRFAVGLEAGRTYRFDLTGRPGGGGTLPDTYFRAIYDSEGRYQSGSYNDDFDGGRDSRVTFTAPGSGTYYARVSGDRNETGTYTLSVTDVTPEQGAGPPAKPRGLEATVSHGQVVLTWDDPDDDSITGYMILRRVRVNDTGGDFSELVADTGSAAATYTDDSVAASLTYTYRIKAINEHGVSERSRWFHIDTPAAPEAAEGDDPDGEDDPVGAPGQGTPGGAGGTDKRVELRQVPPGPQDFEASNGNGQVTLTWTAPAEDADIARHEYRYKTTGDYPDEWTEIDDSAPGKAHEDWVVVTGLTNDTAYTFQLRAANTDGAGTAAEAGPATPKSGFCGRTEQVRNEIMKQPPIKGVTENCAEVTTTQLAGVTGLYLADDEIRSLQPGDFSDLEALETLYLNGNALVSLPAGVFSDLEALETLYLSGNEFSELPAGAFSDLTALQDLSLNHNALVSLPASVFSDLSALQDLALNHNALVSLPAGVFTGLTALDKLYLNNNALVLLPIDGFEDLSVLTHLILYHNELSSLPAGAFNGLTALDTLQLNSNKLTSLPAGVFSDLTKLELLWLSENELSSLPAGVFSDLEALTELRLNNNALSSLPADVFSGLTELQRLYLNVNELTSLPAGVFTGLTALTNLSLRSNKLGELPAGVFSGLTALGRLWLYDNDLTSLPDGVFSGLTALTTLELGDNPTTDRLLPLSVTLVTLENVGSDQVRAEVLAGAPFTVDIPVTVANGALDGEATELRVAAGSVEGTAVTVTPTLGTTAPVTVDIDLTLITQLILPGDHDGYIFVVEGADLPANATTSGVVVVKGSGARGAIAEPRAVRDDEGEITGYTFDTDWFRVELKAGRTYQIDMKGQILSSPGLGTPGEPVDPELTLAPPADQRDLRCGRGLPCQHAVPRRIKLPPPVPGDVSRPCRWHLLHRGERRVVRVGRLRAAGHRHHAGVQAGGRGRAAGPGAQRAQPLQLQHPHSLPAGHGRTGAPGDLQPPRAAPAHPGGRGAGRRRLPGALGRPRRSGAARVHGNLFHAPALSGRGADPADALPRVGAHDDTKRRAGDRLLKKHKPNWPGWHRPRPIHPEGTGSPASRTPAQAQGAAMMTRTDSSNVSGPQPPFMKGEVPMHLKSTDHRPERAIAPAQMSPPPIFSGPRRSRGDDSPHRNPGPGGRRARPLLPGAGAGV